MTVMSLRALTMLLISVMTFAYAQLEEQSSVSSDVGLDLTYEFTNDVRLEAGVSEPSLIIQGASVFDTANAGNIVYSFANDATELKAQVIKVDGVSDTTAELSSWIDSQDSGSYLEFGLGKDNLDLDAYNTGSDYAALIADTDGDGALDTPEVDVDTPSAYILGDSQLGGLTNGGGFRDVAFTYYVAQIGDGPEDNIGSADTTDNASVTIQFTVSNP